MTPTGFEPRQRSRGALVSPGAVFGAVIMAAGVILLLDVNDIVRAEEIFRYWPLALVAAGLWRLVVPGGSSSRVWGAVVLFVGIVFSISVIFRREIDFERIWPFFVIAAGLALLWRALESRGERPSIGDNSPTRLNEWALFGGGDRQITTPEFEGGQALAIFGGWELDFRKAGMKEMDAVIEANCIFGGVVIRVPENWVVVSRVVALFGGVSDKTRHPRPEEVPFPKRLTVRGLALFGGVEIKN